MHTRKYLPLLFASIKHPRFGQGRSFMARFGKEEAKKGELKQRGERKNK